MEITELTSEVLLEITQPTLEVLLEMTEPTLEELQEITEPTSEVLLDQMEPTLELPKEITTSQEINLVLILMEIITLELIHMVTTNSVQDLTEQFLVSPHLCHVSIMIISMTGDILALFKLLTPNSFYLLVQNKPVKKSCAVVGEVPVLELWQLLQQGSRPCNHQCKLCSPKTYPTALCLSRLAMLSQYKMQE